MNGITEFECHHQFECAGYEINVELSHGHSLSQFARFPKFLVVVIATTRKAAVYSGAWVFWEGDGEWEGALNVLTLTPPPQC